MSILRYNGQIVRYNNTIVRHGYVPEFYNTGTLVNYINANISNIKNVCIHIRHGGRPVDDWSSEVHLTEMGVAESIAMGKAFKNIHGDFKYMSTSPVRSQETVFYISQGREDGVLTSYETVPHINFKSSFTKDTEAYERDEDEVGFYRLYKGYCYEGLYLDAFYELEPTCISYVDSMINNNTDAKVTIAATHDTHVFPLIAYWCKNIDFRPDDLWVNFLTGIAAIVYKDGSRKILPITGMTTGYYK